MHPNTRRHAPTLFLGLALAGFAAVAVSAEAEPPEPAAAPRVAQAQSQTQSQTQAGTRCEIALNAIPGGTRIEGRVIAASPVSGTYDLAITSRMGGGHATIRQSGDFTARPGTPALLGETEMLGAPANHAVDLQVRIGPQRLTCASPA